MKKYLLVLPALLVAIWAYAQSTNTITVVLNADVDARLTTVFRIWNACQTNGLPFFSTSTNALTKRDFIELLSTNGNVNPVSIQEIYEQNLIARFRAATLVKQIIALKALE